VAVFRKERIMKPGIVPFVLAAGLAVPILARAADSLVLPAGTAIELEVQTAFSSATVKDGEKFTARTVGGVAVEGQLAIPAGSTVYGQIKKVRSPRDGAKSAAVALKFERLDLPGSPNTDIEGVLTTLKADERRRMLDEWAKISTGYTVDVVLIGAGTEANRKVSTLVGTSGLDRGDLVDNWAKTGLGPDRVDVVPGTRVSMQLEKPVTVPSQGAATGKADRNIFTSAATIKEAQTALKARGLYKGELNGLLDRATRNAIVHYQIDRGLQPTGDADQATVESLRSKQGLPR
jgi:hypothetical protein